MSIEIPRQNFEFVAEIWELKAELEKERENSIDLGKKVTAMKGAIIVLCAAVVLLVIPYIYLAVNGSDGTARRTAASGTPAATASPSQVPLIAPANGQIVEDTIGQDRVAPLTIKTSGSNNYYVLLKMKNSPSSRIGFYISAGGTLETDVPIGTYDIVYATGIAWYGKNRLFGEQTSCYSCEDTFSFYYDGSDSSYVGYTLTLYPVSYGNMDTERIPVSEFY